MNEIKSASKHKKAGKLPKLMVNVETTFSLIGIRTSEPIYKLSIELNERLKVNFLCDDVISFIHKKTNEKIEFAVFVSEDSVIRMRLIANHFENYNLFDELKQFDYLLQLDGEWEIGELGFILYLIRNSSYTEYAAGIDVSILKNKDKIFY